MGGPAPQRQSSTERVRLHITPFNAELLDRYVPASVKPQATNISFHSLETFPERGFGYVELPAMEAQKLKKKFAGTTLKGAKVKIEEARPQKKRKSPDAELEDEGKAKKQAKKEKRKREDGLLEGHELEEGRHVKRGWAEDAKKKGKKKLARQEDSPLQGRKLQFKTKVPPNRTSLESKTTKVKERTRATKKKSKGAKEDVVVKEFATNRKLPQSAIKPGNSATRYEYGKGWLDEAGDVLEAERPSKRPKRAKHESKSKSGTHEELPVSADQNEPEVAQASSSDHTSDTSSIVSDSEAKYEDSADTLDKPAIPDVDSAVEPESPASREIHPLEALYKRPAPRPEDASKPKKLTPIDTSFSFFGAGSADAEDEDDRPGTCPPQTPHTKEDMDWRSIRSAAPTPDTAAIGRRFSFPFPRADKDDDDEEEQLPDSDHDVDMADTGQAVGGAEGEKEESEFRKWFYSNRGDLNRSWKKARREEKKTRRQRENRRLSRRVA